MISLPRLLSPVLLMALTLIMPSCKRESASSQASPTQVVLLTANARRPYEAAQLQIFQRLVANRPGLQFSTQDAAGNADQQARQLEQVLAEKPLAVVFTPVQADRLAPAIAQALQQGSLMLIGLGAESAKLPGVTSLQVDQQGLGRMAGELVVQALQRKAQAEGQSEPAGRVVELRGDEEADSDSGQRHAGFLEVLRKQPGIVLVHEAAGQWSRKGGQERTGEALRLQSRFDVIYAHNDAMALGASAALGQNRQDVMIIGTDGYRGQEGGYSLVNQGDIDASIYQPILVDLALKIIQRRTEDPTFIAKPTYRVAPAVISPKTVDEIRLKGFPPLPDL